VSCRSFAEVAEVLPKLPKLKEHIMAIEDYKPDARTIPIDPRTLVCRSLGTILKTKNPN